MCVCVCVCVCSCGLPGGVHSSAVRAREVSAAAIFFDLWAIELWADWTYREAEDASLDGRALMQEAALPDRGLYGHMHRVFTLHTCPKASLGTGAAE